MPFYERGPVRIHYEEVGSVPRHGLQPSGYLTSMYTSRADFVFTVSRDFVRAIQTPLLVAPDDVPAHPYKVAMEVAGLAPNAEVTIVEHARRFLEEARARHRLRLQKLGLVANGVSCSSCVQQDLSCVCR